MSELKVYHCNEWHNEYTEFYIKSEADKVIAEKDKEIAELKEQVHDYAQGLYVMQARAEKEARHHKHKRCLAMAKWCAACRFAWSFMPDDDEVKDKCKFYEKWKRRWEVLAKEPTWTKFLQLIHKEAK